MPTMCRMLVRSPDCQTAWRIQWDLSMESHGILTPPSGLRGGSEAIVGGGGIVSQGWNRPETWVGLIVLAAGVLAAVIVGLFTYMTLTAKPLHPDPLSAPSVAGSDPSRNWAAA